MCRRERARKRYGRGSMTALDPERSDDSPNSCRSRVMKRTLTAPPVDPDRWSSGGNPARPNLAASAKLLPMEAVRRPPATR